MEATREEMMELLARAAHENGGAAVVAELRSNGVGAALEITEAEYVALFAPSLVAQLAELF